MMKKVLCGVLAVAVAAGTVAVPATSSSAASVPKASYTFNMNKKSSNVVAVSRKEGKAEKKDGSYAVDTTKKAYANGCVPSKSKKVKLVYKKGKKGKGLYLDRNAKYGFAYGAQLKGVKLGSGSWTVAFWVKPESDLGDYMSVFFTGNGKNIATKEKTAWVSITRMASNAACNGGSWPTIWSRNAAKDRSKNHEGDIHFPWYAYQDADGNWKGVTDDPKANGMPKGKWSYITLVVDTKKKNWVEYGEKGTDGYVKSYHGWTYVNGALFGNGAVAEKSMSNSNVFFLGINAWDAPFKGMIDEVQFWKKALTGKQVKALYKKAK